MEVRPINANTLVEHLERLSEDYAEIHERLKNGDVSKAVMYGKFTALVETMIDVKRMPTLDYEPVRHGEWIMKSDDNSFGVCSWCNRSDHIDPLATHCRYCGTKMDGGK